MLVWAAVADSVAIMLQSKFAKLWHFHSWTYRFGWATFALRDKRTSSGLSMSLCGLVDRTGLLLAVLFVRKGFKTEQRHDCHAWSVQWQARPGWSGCQSPDVCHADSVPCQLCVCTSCPSRVSPDSGAKLRCLFPHPSEALVYHSVPPSLHHWYLMRWRRTSRFIGSVQTDPNLIRLPDWNACPRCHCTSSTA